MDPELDAWFPKDFGKEHGWDMRAYTNAAPMDEGASPRPSREQPAALDYKHSSCQYGQLYPQMQSPGRGLHSLQTPNGRLAPLHGAVSPRAVSLGDTRGTIGDITRLWPPRPGP